MTSQRLAKRELLEAVFKWYFRPCGRHWQQFPFRPSPLHNPALPVSCLPTPPSPHSLMLISCVPIIKSEPLWTNVCASTLLLGNGVTCSQAPALIWALVPPNINNSNHGHRTTFEYSALGCLIMLRRGKLKDNMGPLDVHSHFTIPGSQ